METMKNLSGTLYTCPAGTAEETNEPSSVKLQELPTALLCAHQQLCVAAASDTNLTLGKALSAQGFLLPPCLQTLQPSQDVPFS